MILEHVPDERGTNSEFQSKNEKMINQPALIFLYLWWLMDIETDESTDSKDIIIELLRYGQAQMSQNLHWFYFSMWNHSLK